MMTRFAPATSMTPAYVRGVYGVCTPCDTRQEALT
jgi:hypothetical protein